jgi:peptidoglycan/xylan/chitin deacetylase (PgdA/CDA1 family)
MRVALKIDVSTEMGATTGVLNLIELFAQYDVNASFFFSVEFGGSRGLVKRAASLFGKSVPPRMRLEEAMLAVVEAGHEIGLLGFEASSWRKQAAFADADWTRHQLALGMERFEQIVGHVPDRFAAPYWQPKAHLLGMEERRGFSFASDVRGRYPFYPQLHNIVSRCPQIPTTLPTLGEMLAWGEVTLANVHEYLYAESRHVLPHGHVYTADAAEEGIEHLPVMEKLIVMWKGQEGTLRSLGEVRAELDLEELPVHQVGWTQLPGRQEHVAAQSLRVDT